MVSGTNSNLPKKAETQPNILQNHDKPCGPHRHNSPRKLRTIMNIKIRVRAIRSLVLTLCFCSGAGFAATNEISALVSKGLFEEEANRDLDAAIRMYRSAVDHFDTDRNLAATALFRLGECYRKQGNSNDALIQYQRVLKEFPDQAPLVVLSRQNMAALGSPETASQAARAATNS